MEEKDVQMNILIEEQENPEELEGIFDKLKII